MPEDLRLGLDGTVLTISSDAAFHEWLVRICPRTFRVIEANSVDHALYQLTVLSIDLLCVDVDATKGEWPLLVSNNAREDARQAYSTILFHAKSRGALPSLTADMKYHGLYDRDDDPLGIRRELIAMMASVQAYRGLQR